MVKLCCDAGKTAATLISSLFLTQRLTACQVFLSCIWTGMRLVNQPAVTEAAGREQSSQDTDQSRHKLIFASIIILHIII